MVLTFLFIPSRGVPRLLGTVDAITIHEVVSKRFPRFHCFGCPSKEFYIGLWIREEVFSNVNIW